MIVYGLRSAQRKHLCNLRLVIYLLCVQSPGYVRLLLHLIHVPYITRKSVSEDDTVVLSLFAVIFLMCLLRTLTDFVLAPLFILCMAPITMFVYDNNG